MNDRYMVRAKRLDNGEWIHGFLGPHNRAEPTFGEWYIVADEPDEGWHYSANVAVNTLGQCTGLKDKNGNLILRVT